MINIRTKGAEGERELCKELNLICWIVYKELGVAYDVLKEPIQRNQLQTAVGGSDLVGPAEFGVGVFGMQIEVKRQEQLSINTWWAQCKKACEEFGGIPVLLFRQNATPGKKTAWRCMIEVDASLPAGAFNDPMTQRIRAEIAFDDFKTYFKQVVKNRLHDKVCSTAITLTVVPTAQVVESGLFDV